MQVLSDGWPIAPAVHGLQMKNHAGESDDNPVMAVGWGSGTTLVIDEHLCSGDESGIQCP